MDKLNKIAMLLYGKPYNDLEPHQQYDVQQTVNNPDYQYYLNKYLKKQ